MKSKSLLLFGNAESVHLQRWATGMQSRGMRVAVISRYHHEIPNVDVYALQKKGQNKCVLLWNILKLPFLVRQINPDIVNGHYVSSYGLLAAFSSFKPLFLMAWGSDILRDKDYSLVRKYFLKLAYKRCHSFGTNSTVILDKISDRYSSSSKKGHFLFWGIDSSVYSYVDRKVEEVFTVLSNRHLESLYNIDVIIKAFMVFEKKYEKPVKLIVAGTGSEEIYLKTLQGNSNIEFIGFLKGDPAMVEVLHNAHLYVSIPETDGMPVSVMEALSTGIPTIGSDISANRELNIDTVDIDVDVLAKRMLDMAINYTSYVCAYKKKSLNIKKLYDRKKCMDEIYNALTKVK